MLLMHPTLLQFYNAPKHCVDPAIQLSNVTLMASDV